MVCCMVLPIVLGSAVSYMHYSNPAWRKRRGHAPASELSSVPFVAHLVVTF